MNDTRVSLIKEYGLPYPFIGVSFDERAYNLRGHSMGLSVNDPITLASVFKILAEQPLDSDLRYSATSARWLGY